MDAAEIKKLREGMGVSTRRFAGLMGVSVRTVQNWECEDKKKRIAPAGPALKLLRQVATFYSYRLP